MVPIRPAEVQVLARPPGPRQAGTPANAGDAGGEGAFTRLLTTPDRGALDGSGSRQPLSGLPGLEALVLRQLVETLLPRAAAGAHGARLSADTWRSMLAQHVADALAGAGGLGIARAISAPTPPAPVARSATPAPQPDAEPAR